MKHRGKFWWENPVEFEERDYMRFGYVTVGTVRAGKHSGVEHPGCVAELERLARGATPGPWSWHAKQTVDGDSWAVFDGNDSALATNHDGWAPDAEFIAAANPSTVLALVERVREAEAEVEEWRASHKVWSEEEAPRWVAAKHERERDLLERARKAEARIEKAEDFITRHYLDTGMGRNVLAALNEGDKQ